MVYIVGFFSSAFFLWLGTKHCRTQKINNEQWKKMRPKWMPVGIGLLIPILIAAVRSTSVGSDVEFYVVPHFEYAVEANSFHSYMEYLGGVQDYGYSFLNYVISRFTNDIRVLFLIIEALIILFTFSACWKLRNIAPPWLSMLFYYLIFYNITLSTVRQSCALSIYFFVLSIFLLDEKKLSKYVEIIVLLGIALLFHSTSIFAVPILFLGYLIKNGKLSSIRFGVLLAVICSMINVFEKQFNTILYWITPFVSKKYAKGFFLDKNAVGASGHKMEICLGILVLLIQLAQYRRERYDRKKENHILLGLNAIYVVVMLTLSNYTFIPRLMYYIEITWAITLAQTGKLFSKSKQERRLMTLLALLVAFMFWILYFIIGRVHGTYPYVLG